MNKLSELDRFMLGACVAVFVMAGTALVIGYRIGYADGARQAAPLAAPPTKTERAR